ncbi:putative MFS family arabinose efflux permease [Sphingobium fontiphilum]|uniref:Putative MFS family arabinose efflux permease n=1 Tax=Sphingobium fontiphilum TaxID=944425 RepID=A0A7W6GNY5_9SPHN|nr:putative MFS family arabinose efflux permease [Sphingobium fontiphilum]
MIPAAGGEQAAEQAGPLPSRNRRLVVLALTTLVYFFYLLDRNAIIVTQELFKAEFGLTDTQVGLATGILYGVAYAVVGIPIGWMIQRTHRVRLLASLVAIWSGVTVLCGMATQFWHLAAARVLVGAAESGGAPVSLSILHPLFGKEKRATVSSLFFAGAGLGVIVSFMAGGYIATHYGWRSVFFIYGAPGLVLALAILLIIPEPPRAATRQHDGTGMMRDVWALLKDRRLRPVYVGSILFSSVNAGIGAWLVSFLMRVHELTLPQAGAAVALGLGVFGTAGSLTLAVIADKAEARRPGGLLLVIALCAIANGVAAIAAVAAGTTLVAMIALSLWGITAIAYSGPSNAAIGEMAPPHLTGVAFSLFAVLCNLIGSGLGPLLVGRISDIYLPTMGSDSLRPAMAILAGLQVLAAAAYLVAMSRWRRSVTEKSIEKG